MNITRKRLLAAGVSAILLLSAPALRLSAREGKGPEGMGMKEMMKDKLDLSDEQAKQFKDMGKTHREANKAVMEKMKLDMDTLRVLVDEKASDAKLKAQLNKLKQDGKDMEAMRAKHMEAMQAILTPMQQAKFVIFKVANMGQMKGKGMGMGDKPKDCNKNKGGDKEDADDKGEHED